MYGTIRHVVRIETKSKRGGNMNKKIWATLVVVLLVVCPVAIVSISNEASSAVKGYDVVFDPGEGGDSPDGGVGGNDPEHPQ